MAKNVTAPKADPADVASVAIDAIAAGEHEIVVDDFSRGVLAKLSDGVAALYPELH